MRYTNLRLTYIKVLHQYRDPLVQVARLSFRLLLLTVKSWFHWQVWH